MEVIAAVILRKREEEKETEGNEMDWKGDKRDQRKEVKEK